MPDVLTLRRHGASHRLNENVLGFNCPVPWEVPHEDPALVEPLRDLAPGILRFPGGTVANFFNWRTGHLDLEEVSDESVYREYVRSRIPETKKMHPNGASMTGFTDLARKVGAEVVLVANLETATVQDQVEWLESMRDDDVLPKQVELGNEFYHAMLGDPISTARFPDYDTTAELSRQYAEAFRTVLDPDAKLAIQAAPSAFHLKGDMEFQGHYDPSRIRDWDANLRPEPWFEAVTVHPYPSMDGVAGPGARSRFEDEPEPVYQALLARVDDGLRRCLDNLVAMMPGKEIWISEWGMGEFGHFLKGEPPAVLTNTWIHAYARYMLGALAYPEMRWMAIHGLYGNGNQWAPVRRKEEGGYAPSGPYQLLRMFHHTVNGGAMYRPVTIDGATRLAGRGTIPDETFATVEAALFERTDGTHLLIHNASSDARSVDLRGIDLGAPVSIESIPAADLTASPSLEPPKRGDGELVLELPAYSIQRAIWSSGHRHT